MQYIKYLPEWNRHVALELYYEGSDYLYGALFRICFPHYYNGDQLESSNTNDSNKNMKNNLPVSRTKQKKQSKKNVVSFVFLSVPNSLDDTETSRSGGSQNQVDDDDERYSRNIDDGIKCLRQLLPLSDDPNTCQIVVLSSQPIIVERITQWITSSKRQCTVIHSRDLKSSLSSSSSSPTASSEKMGDVRKNQKHPDSSSSSTASTHNDNVDNTNDDNTTDDENENDDSEQNNDDYHDESHTDDDGNVGSRKHRPSSKRNNRNRNRHRQTKDKKSRGRSDDTTQSKSRSGGSTGSTIDRIPLSDLAMASNMVRTGVIGHTDHPDFQLLVEWIAYHRQMEYVNAHDDDNNKYDRQRRRRTSSVSTSDIPNSATVEPLLWCAL